ncbi:unnamed protein product [Microthlaspi erraticum]|uniref:FKB95-like N-terminal Kelch domain-containing protein n=1 Tax=Microthlaspi erraticum TaxID=1685480 RepID=A0A6D2IT50_9BRAS|nr:unnamed protein product [Microthlaspi erraticum]
MKHEEVVTDDAEIFGDYSLFPIHSFSRSPPVSRYSIIAVGCEIYVIGGLTTPSSSVRVLDCLSHTWYDAPSMTVARTRPESVLLDQKIYVMGGCGRCDNWFEVFDIETQSWSVLRSRFADRDELRRGSMVYALQGKLHVVSERSECTYEPKSGTWEVDSYHGMVDVTVIENVMYCCSNKEYLMWCDDEDRKWKDIKGLENLGQYLISPWDEPRLFNYGGKLVVVWRQTLGQDFVNGESKVWCAKIALERLRGEIWGEIEWLNTVLRVPECYFCLNCAVVSI